MTLKNNLIEIAVPLEDITREAAQREPTIFVVRRIK